MSYPKPKRKLAAAMGNPQNFYQIFHVAVSKSKGSTLALLAAALQANGAKVGLFTSPHLRSYRKRIRVFNATLDDQLLLDSCD